jgi:DNA-binding GntR family transcriptional regulator
MTLVKESLSTQIYQQLRRNLMAGRYEPGQKLKLRDLADQLGISVTPVREALARLASDHAVVQVDHRSVRVAAMDIDRFNEIRELRMDLEAKAAHYAADSATRDDIDRLVRIHQRLKEARASQSYADIVLANQEFHLELCVSARMPVLQQLIEVLWLRCGPLMNGLTQWPAPKPKQHPHALVIKALRARDGAMASAAIRQDIEMGTKALRFYLTTHTERPDWARQTLPPASSAVRVSA